MTSKKVFKVVLMHGRCKECGICVEFCPQKVFQLNENKPQVAAEELCTGCRLCEYRCPDFASTIKEGN
ncbi:MAG: 4Fe-4S dicluster domain-containing protein [Peptococcaceae bacterium]